MPYDMADPIDFFIISVRNTTSLGQFIFPMNVLHKHGFISKDGIGGKRAMRLYAPWDITDNHQAKKTQSWQLKYFLEITPKFAIATARTLLGIWRNEGNLDK